MRPALLRLLALFNLAVGLVSLIFLLPFWLKFFELGSAPPVPEALEKWQTDRATCIQMAGVLTLYFLLLTASGWMLWRKSGWGRPVTLALGGVMAAQAVWHAFMTEWEIVLVLASYAVLIGLLLVPKEAKTPSPR